MNELPKDEPDSAPSKLGNASNEHGEVHSTSELMLSMLLRDFLSENRPPDFRPRILSKLKNVVPGNAPSALTNAEFDQAVQVASREINDGYGVVIPPPVATVPADDRELALWIRRNLILTAALAAAVMGAIFLPNVLRSWNGTPTGPSIAKDAIQPNSNSNISLDPSDRNNKEPDTSLPLATSSDDAEKESIAQNSVKPKSQTLPSSTSQVSQTSVASNAMKDGEIVSVIDNQLSFLWKRVGMTVASEVQTEVWLDRVAVAVLGRQATSAEKEAFRSNKSESKIANYVDGLLSSGEFSRYWSSRLAEHYLGKRLRSTRDQSEMELAFVAWLEEEGLQKAFVGNLERQIIAGPENRSYGTVVRTDAAAYWIAETMERAATVQRESMESVSLLKKREPREESLIGVSRQLMRLSGNPSLVCSQCHIDETASSDLRGYIAMSKVKGSVGSNAFWRVPASLSGLTLSYQDSKRSLRQEVAKDYFYEDSDGRMKLANSGPPSLMKATGENNSLAEWFGVSSEPRRAIVDMIWDTVFEQPLVPAIGLSEGEGLSERVDLRDLLASQMQARKADLGTLVRWVVLSKALWLEGPKTDAPWYLKSTESQIAASQKQMRIFASYPRIDSANVESGKLPTGKVLSWIEQKRSFQKSDAALAQGANATGQSRNSKQLKLDYSEDQIRYLISVDEPYSQVKAVADRWANSSMSWPMLLEHAYLATDARFPTRAERDEADKLLDATGKNRMRTLVMLVNARLGSW